MSVITTFLIITILTNVDLVMKVAIFKERPRKYRLSITVKICKEYLIYRATLIGQIGQPIWQASHGMFNDF